MTKGRLFLIPTSLGEYKENQFPAYNKEIITQLDTFIVEDLRSARRFLRQAGYTKDFDTDTTFFELNKHSDSTDYPTFLKKIEQGIDIGLLSEAGCPCIADPGADIVKIAQEKKYTISPLIGPSSILLALMASGFNGQNFAFLGYLPIDKAARQKKIKQIETKIYAEHQTQIMIETPFRNQSLFEEILKNTQDSTMLCIGKNLTLSKESILTKSISDWRKFPIDLQKQPAIFLLYK